VARARNIKPGFFENEELAELGPLAMLLFEGLWCLADREGRLEDRPRRIKAQLFPYFRDSDEALSTMVSSAAHHGCRTFAVNVDAMLDALYEREFIIRYTTDGVRYIQVVNFEKHQRPHSNETPSTIPPHNHADSHSSHKTLATKVDSAVDQGEQRFGLIPDTGLSDTGLSDCGVQGDSGADAPAKPKTKRASQMTDDWRVGEDDRVWAIQNGFEPQWVDRETEKFVDHFKATGKPMKDWDAAWKNWMRRSREFGPARASPNGHSPPQRRARELGYQGEVRELT
jgi:hypothetical protein